MKLFVFVLNSLSFLTTISTNVSDTLEDPIDIACQPSDVNGHVYFVSHPFDCQKFFMCQGYVGILMHCPGNLQFVTSLNICNYESEVQCENTQSHKEPTVRSTTNLIASKDQDETTTPDADSLLRKSPKETTTERILVTDYTEEESTSMNETTTPDGEKINVTEEASSILDQLMEKFYFLLNIRHLKIEIN